MPANPYIFTNGTFHEIRRKPQNRRARLAKSGFKGLREIDQKVKGTPFARFWNQAPYCFESGLDAISSREITRNRLKP